MTEKLASYISWKVVTSAVCIILFAMAGSLWSANNNRMTAIEAKLEQKVDYKRYEADMARLESKMDQLINIHMAGVAYKRIR